LLFYILLRRILKNVVSSTWSLEGTPEEKRFYQFYQHPFTWSDGDIDAKWPESLSKD
jgi:hypothetical protein